MQILKTISSFISFTKRSKQTSVMTFDDVLLLYGLHNWQMTAALMTLRMSIKS